MPGEQSYNDPIGGSPSDIGTQFRTDYYEKKALIEAAKQTFFGQLADTTAMPKNMGKTMKQYLYLPLLDDANINDQGIDANGVGGDDNYMEVTITIFATSVPTGAYSKYYAVGEGVDATAAETASQAKALDIINNDILRADADYATYGEAVTGVQAAGYTVTDPGDAGAVPHSGNLYGSSKDIGYIPGKMPVLSESGGRVNRVGFKRLEVEGTIEKYGFFDEYTKESLDFDTDSELEMHVTNEMVKGANEMTEDLLQMDLLNGAGVIRFGGDATATDEVTGEGVVSEIAYEDLMRLNIDLDNNRCPKNTKIISGTRMVDTRVVDAARYMYIGSELSPMVKKMVDPFGNQAFIPVQQYAAGGNLAVGEIGTIDQFRIIVVPEMMHWAGAGADVGINEGYREQGDKYNVYPMLVVGSGSFTTIGFQTDGKTVKFKIKHSKPESNTSYSYDDPYGELGFMSIKWYYGAMILRPERIALCKTVAEW